MSESRPFRVLVLAGDHAGPEIMVEALKVLDVISSTVRPATADPGSKDQGKIVFDIRQELCGGCSIDKHATPITDEVLRIAEESDAVLFGSVGGPEWGTSYPNPESGLLRLRQHLNAFANLRPAVFHSKSLIPLSPLKPEIASRTNFVVVRENCGGAYFGPKVEPNADNNFNFASDTWQYSREEIERCGRVAAVLARTMVPAGSGRKPLVTSSDKANVLASGRLWRRVVTELYEREFPDVELKHQLADSLSMLMLKDPGLFSPGVILTDNTFGDMLSDQAGGVVGTLGTLPSASLCGIPTEVETTVESGSGEGRGRCNGIYEPVHGSAPDIAGRGIVNPIAQILSVAMMLRYSLGLGPEADLIEQAVQKVLDAKDDKGGLEIRTGDLGGKNTTREVGDAVCMVLSELLQQK